MDGEAKTGGDPTQEERGRQQEESPSAEAKEEKEETSLEKSPYEQYQDAARVFREEAANMRLFKKNAVTKKIRVSRGMHFSEDKGLKPKNSAR